MDRLQKIELIMGIENKEKCNKNTKVRDFNDEILFIWDKIKASRALGLFKLNIRSSDYAIRFFEGKGYRIKRCLKDKQGLLCESEISWE